MKEMTLREVCLSCGVSRRAVQGYEKHGLVSATGKTDRGYLLYDEETQEKIRQIKKLQNFGFTVKEIAVFQRLGNDEKISVMKSKLVKLVEYRDEITANVNELMNVIDWMGTN